MIFLQMINKGHGPSSDFKLEPHTSASGRAICDMAWASRRGSMVHPLPDSGETTMFRVLESFNTPMEMSLLVSGTTTPPVVLEPTTTRVESPSTLVNGSRICSTAMAWNGGMAAQSTADSSSGARSKATECTSGPMGVSFMASGMRIQSVVWATMLDEMVGSLEVSGRMPSYMAAVDTLGQMASRSRVSMWMIKSKASESSVGGMVDALKGGGVKERCMAMESLTELTVTC
mmetsp:Transcript_10550/g.19160  ORF Transcript_10550/g.19160 Transcript_10550/m.19160 type:complete len:231 (+) Transcript_10550:395-1087(+)